MERARDPRTRPINRPTEFASRDALITDYSPSIQWPNAVGVHPLGGQIRIGLGRAQLQIDPLLSFMSRSPDRCWTLFSPRAQRIGPPRKLVAIEQSAPRAMRAWYVDDGASMLAVDANDPRRIEIDARSQLPAAVFSHLNSHAELAIAGHRKLRIAFSPCPDQLIDVMFADYPFGAPLRFAYFDAAASRLRIVEATNAEKGPFRELAAGGLSRGEPLTITLFDGDAQLVAITLHDWSAQASDEISPTAGFGVPANSIEFSLAAPDARSPASIFVSLASTGVGRGYDTVGHAAGTYENRMTIEIGEPLTSSSPVPSP